MPTVLLVVNALGIALVVGGALSAYLWWVRRKQLEVSGGIRALAGMRWREFSRFVIEALHAQGFEASRIEPAADSGQQADLLLSRGEQTWLLSCKQSANYRISAAQVAELAIAVRDSGAAGGILATLGRIEPQARERSQGIELIDGATLWPLVDPLLPPSLHQHLAQQALARTKRALVGAWLAALLFGGALALALTDSSPRPAPPGPAMTSTPSPAPAPPPAARAPAPAATPKAALPPAPMLSEDEQRRQVMEVVSALPGIERAVWSTRSTLLVYVSAQDDDQRVARICKALERFDELRAARLHLQPPPGSASAVRFVQCQLF
ncbi:restriction endonuclease [Lysobacter koreensis]|uniref:Restriction endonuclease n=1 Tax=Lysobacter koreensis TaxID=266122 RepID=A0ABW2YKE8_9GAMM